MPKTVLIVAIFGHFVKSSRKFGNDAVPGAEAPMRRSLVFLAVTLLVSALGGLGSYTVFQAQKNQLIESASADLTDATGVFIQALNGVFEPALAIGATIKTSGIVGSTGPRREELFFALTPGKIIRYEQISGAFIGFPDGQFLHAQDLAVDSEGKDSEYSVTGRIIDRPASDPRGRRKGYIGGATKWEPFDVNAKPYDPRTRPWYKIAVLAKKPIWTQAYTFASSGQLGVTYAEPLYDASGKLWGVLGIDLTLGALSRTLLNTSKALVSVADIVFATDLKDQLVGHPGIVATQASVEIAALIEGFGQDTAFEQVLVKQLNADGSVQIVETDTLSYLASKSQLDPAQAMPLHIFLAKDLKAVLASAVTGMYRNMALVFLGIVIFGIVATYAVKLRVEVAAREAAEKELIIARDIAEAATQAKSTFLATMSHEIRTPMNGVMSMAELLGLTRLDGEQRRMAGIITDSASALLTIINDILDFSKIEAGKLEIETVELSLMDVVQGSAELLAPRAEDKGLDILVDIDTNLVDRRLGDPTRLRQILLNLGGNAVKFTEAGGIGITVRQVEAEEDRFLRFEVSDTGIGLTEEQRGKLFQAFVQADSSTSRKYGGTGLGLSICQKLTELMDGRIGVDSVAGEGSIFWFEVPMEAIGD